MQLRLRKVNVSSSCGGIACRQDLLKETRTCTKHIDLDCKLTTWSNWSLCSSGCGNGTVQRSRNITLQAKCRGKNCEVLIETTSCSSYRDRTHCQVFYSISFNFFILIFYLHILHYLTGYLCIKLKHIPKSCCISCRNATNINAE